MFEVGSYAREGITVGIRVEDEGLDSRRVGARGTIDGRTHAPEDGARAELRHDISDRLQSILRGTHLVFLGSTSI
jgi:hypothetical protein